MTNCERCGANLAMVGRAHRCITKSGGGVEAETRNSTRLVPSGVESAQSTERNKPELGQRAFAGVAPGPSDSKTAWMSEEPLPDAVNGGKLTTYRYRDPEKWRAYMRDYMRKRRAKHG